MIIEVNTPGGRGTVWGIDRGKVIVEHDFMYLVEYEASQVKGVDITENPQ